MASPVYLAAAVLIVAPGALVLRAAGLVWLWSIGLAPAVSLGVVGAILILFWLVRIPWDLATVLLVLGLLLAPVWGVRRIVQRRDKRTPSPPERAGNEWSTIVAGGLGVVLCLIRFVQVVGAPDAISQGIDAPFHANLVRLILDTHEIGYFTSAELSDAIDMYPPLWHGFAALVVNATGVSIPLASNAMNAAVCAVAWPVSAVAATRAMVGRRAAAIVPSGVASAGMYIFPWTGLQGEWGDFGALFPFTMSTAVLPVTLALLGSILGFRLRGRFPGRLPALGMLGLVVLGLAMSQTSGVVAVAAFAAPLLLIVAARVFINLRRRRAELIWYFRWAATCIVLGVLYFLGWTFARSPLGTGWGPFTDLWGALWGALSLAPVDGPEPWVLTVCSIAGMVALSRSRGRWILASYVGVLYLYVVGAVADNKLFRGFTTGAWWGDNVRLGAMLPMFAVIFIAAFGDWAAGCMARFRRTNADPLSEAASRGPAVAVAGGLAVVVAVSVLFWPGQRPHDPDRVRSFGLWPDAPILSTDEFELLSRLGSEVPAGVSIANNPWDGSSMAYALADRFVLFPHAYRGSDPDHVLIAESLRDAAPGAPVCAALDRLNTRYVLNFGTHWIDPNRVEVHQFPGIEDLETSKAVQLVDRQGDAKLYRITACRG
ncbi:DUF6541 family protein [Sinomonas sp. B1-1]|uniref:DUF6541 family protein n=1 Tax=Sinomonas sp. B1-1 TaxID=3141454 RepID=UPI003D268EE7